jgi:hypothetical protein
MISTLKRHPIYGWLVHQSQALPHHVSNFYVICGVVHPETRDTMVDIGEMLTNTKVDTLVAEGVDTLQVMHRSGGTPFTIEIEWEMAL